MASALRLTVLLGMLALPAFALCHSPAAAAGRELGVDVSRFQGQTGMPQENWTQLAQEGRKFAFIKATEGLLPPGNIDPAWDTNVPRAQAAGILAGVYHFARPDNRPNVPGAIAEAGHFVLTAGSAMNPGNLRPVLDLERVGATQTGADLTDWVLAFNDEVVRLKGPGAEPIIYTTGGFAAFLDSRVAGLDLWIRSINGQDPHTGQPSSTGSFSTWAFWQYQVGPAGGISEIDLNVQNTDALPLSAFVVPEPVSAALILATIAIASRRRVA